MYKKQQSIINFDLFQNNSETRKSITLYMQYFQSLKSCYVNTNTFLIKPTKQEYQQQPTILTYKLDCIYSTLINISYTHLF